MIHRHIGISLLKGMNTFGRRQQAHEFYFLRTTLL